MDPDSPLSIGLSSAATSVSEMDDLLGDIISLESVEANTDHDLALFDPVHTSQTVSAARSRGGGLEGVAGSKRGTRGDKAGGALEVIVQEQEVRVGGAGVQ